jgi:hypothetical protein
LRRDVTIALRVIALRVAKETKHCLTLHERSDKEIRDKLSSGELSDKKASIARAILRRRRQERWQAWFKRHEWLAALLTALGLADIFSIGRSASEEGSG